MPSGLTLWPFADDPHITQEGFILHGHSAEIRAKVYCFLLQREIPSNVAPSVPEHLEWHHENGSLIQIFTFRSLEHLALQAFPPPAKRRADISLRNQHFRIRYQALCLRHIKKRQYVSVGFMQLRPRDHGHRKSAAVCKSRLKRGCPIAFPFRASYKKRCAEWRQFGRTLEHYHTIQNNPLRVTAMPTKVELGRARNLHRNGNAGR